MVSDILPDAIIRCLSLLIDLTGNPALIPSILTATFHRNARPGLNPCIAISPLLEENGYENGSQTPASSDERDSN